MDKHCTQYRSHLPFYRLNDAEKTEMLTKGETEKTDLWGVQLMLISYGTSLDTG